MTSLRAVANKVAKRWPDLVIGDFVRPPCPPPAVLHRLLEQVNYAAGFPEEGRYPRFNVTAAPTGHEVPRLWRLSSSRALSVAELRRVLPVADFRKCAVHIEWSEEGELAIAGIQDLGTSWHRARAGLAYHYDTPQTLLVEVERPNRFTVYQGMVRVGSFSDGECDIFDPVLPPTFLHRPTHGGLRVLSRRIVRPQDEPAREYMDFEFIALWNCYAALANSVGDLGHGGAIIIVPPGSMASLAHLRPKYPMKAASLTDAFVEFINARHEVGDLEYRDENGARPSIEDAAAASWRLQRALDNLVEGLRLVARLTACDGAVVISQALEVLGFGCEITADLRDATPVYAGPIELHGEKQLDVEQFGMRHRSAVKFVSQCSDAVVVVVSQDGPATGVWGECGAVHVHKGLRLVNLNLAFA